MSAKNIPSHLKIALSSIKCFANDGKLDVEELNQLLSIAEEDGCIDSEEARVLTNVMSRALDGDVDAATISRIQELSTRVMQNKSDNE